MIDVQPFIQVIDCLSTIDEFHSPMLKLEHIYKACTTEIKRCLDDFWENREIPLKKLLIDADNLQAILVYVVSRMQNCPWFLSNLALI